MKLRTLQVDSIDLKYDAEREGQNALLFPSIQCSTSSKMAATTEFNSALFMETVQRYECLYNKFSRDYKNKFTRMNCWRTIGGQFNLEPAEAERKYKNIRSAYCRFLKKKKAVPSGSGRDAVPVPTEFSNLDSLVSHINHRAATVSNLTNSCRLTTGTTI